jgi:type II secretory pathway pseudopilin PulG
MLYTNTQRDNRNQQSGFSMVEFIVILSLFAIMASVVTFDFQRYRNTIDKSNLTGEIALAYRQMQVFGISSTNRVIGEEGFETDSDTVESLVNDDVANERSVYGVQLDFENQRLLLYQDYYYSEPGFTPGGTPEFYEPEHDRLVDALQIQGDNQILRVCLTDSPQEPSINSTNGSCIFPSGNGYDVSSEPFSVRFQRPFPDASFKAVAVSDSSYEAQIALFAIGSPEADPTDLQYIRIDSVGLIQITQPVFSE